MRRHQRGFVSDFVDEVQSAGRLIFALGDVVAAGGPSGEALEKAVHRLQARGRVRRISGKSDCILIVPPEYRSLGAPPIEWWLDDVMQHLGLPYYVGLFSAAEWHGEAHYAVMETQVVVPHSRRPMHVGRTRIRFFASSTIATTPVETRASQWSIARVSTPAATLVDLLRYRRCGVDRIGEIARSLQSKLKPGDLWAALSAANSIPSAQRLGYVFDHVGAGTAAQTVERWLSGKGVRLLALEPGAGCGWQVDRRWNIEVNVHLGTSA